MRTLLMIQLSIAILIFFYFVCIVLFSASFALTAAKIQALQN